MAIKVVRRIRKYTESAAVEVAVLFDLARADPSGSAGCVRLLRAFMWNGHQCLVFEPLGASLYDVVRANKYRPLPLYCVQAFADQLVCALAFLHSIHVIHTDLKLENVLLVSRDALVRTDKTTSARDAAKVRMGVVTEGVGMRCSGTHS